MMTRNRTDTKAKKGKKKVGQQTRRASQHFLLCSLTPITGGIFRGNKTWRRYTVASAGSPKLSQSAFLREYAEKKDWRHANFLVRGLVHKTGRHEKQFLSFIPPILPPPNQHCIAITHLFTLPPTFLHHLTITTIATIAAIATVLCKSNCLSHSHSRRERQTYICICLFFFLIYFLALHSFLHTSSLVSSFPLSRHSHVTSTSLERQKNRFHFCPVFSWRVSVTDAEKPALLVQQDRTLFPLCALFSSLLPSFALAHFSFSHWILSPSPIRCCLSHRSTTSNALLH